MQHRHLGALLVPLRHPKRSCRCSCTGSTILRTSALREYGWLLQSFFLRLRIDRAAIRSLRRDADLLAAQVRSAMSQAAGKIHEGHLSAGKAQMLQAQIGQHIRSVWEYENPRYGKRRAGASCL